MKQQKEGTKTAPEGKGVNSAEEANGPDEETG